jgi:hypothetical protein
MYKTASRNMQSRTRQASQRPVSDRDRKINAKLAKRSAAHKRLLADAIAAYEANFVPKK